MADLKSDSQRVVDLKAALKIVKPKDTLTLDDCAAIWGVTKPRFVNRRREMVGFPDHVEKVGNAYFYPAKGALQAMLGLLERHKAVDTNRSARIAKMTGQSAQQAAAESTFTPADLARLNRLRAEVEERERAMGLYVP